MEMDTDAVERLALGLYAQKKRKKKAPGSPYQRRWTTYPTLIRVICSWQSGHHILDHLKRANCLEAEGHNPSSPIDADPLPQGVPLKPLIKSLKKKFHHLKKKLKKMEDDL
ncbi:hypothetical protein COCNU_07G002190 [Cocos nucifera]|uniref:Uncharacterized protein n=1 Tax=Cocos nucifera TaxID=13894 RepID=A0A8K0IEP2_COCNU|nr:hypothetical protein COCNU_07G002190 [Cocos nucifera]